MPLQTVVRRQYTTGFVGDFTKDGPMRSESARISSLTTDANGNTNRFGRAYGYSGEVTQTGVLAAREKTVALGALPFFGIMFNPNVHSLGGTALGGSLAPTLDLPQGAVSQFASMISGLVIEIFNETTASKTCAYGDGLAYVTTATTALQNPNGIPLGGIVTFTGATPPTGFTAIPNGRVTNVVTLTASAPGAVVSGNNLVDLTQ